MSYKYSILSDYPIAFYQSQNLSTNSLPSYQDVINEYATYEDFLAAYPNYTAVVTNLIEDSSPCNNDGGYFGDPDRTLVPLITGEQHAFRIDDDNYIAVTLTNDYNTSIANGGLGTQKTSDNDFTLEAWIYPKISSTGQVAIIGDTASSVGLFYEAGSLLFKANSQTVRYTIPFLNKAIHVAAVYRVNSMSIYVDGSLANYTILSDFTFSNTSLELKAGPTANATDYFLLNGLAVYRYALSEPRIKNHYLSSQPTPAIQVVYPDNGQLFEMFDTAVSSPFKHQYPIDKPWDLFQTDKLFYDVSANTLSVLQLTASQAVSETIEDFIKIPDGFDMDSSKIEWDGDNGITVFTSIDGTTYAECINGESIPQYKLGGFDLTRNLYIRIVFTTSDASKYVPVLRGLSVVFYNNQKVYASNSGAYIYTMEEDAIASPSVTLGSKRYPILSRDSRNGITPVSGSGFNAYTDRKINTLEFFYTPSSLSQSGIVWSSAGIEYEACNLSWNAMGVISSTNIAAIYVNGINRTSATNVSGLFTAGQIHHVVIVFIDPISEKITFNYSVGGSVKATYQNIALYETAFDSTKSIGHYSIYLKNNSIQADDSPLYVSATLTEDSISLYSGNWNVVQEY